MANTSSNRTDSGQHFGWHDTAGGPQLGQPDELKPTNPFSSMVQSFRDVFFPEKLPPLVLESQPIAVDNPMDFKRDPKSTAVAVGVHALIFLLIFWIGKRVVTVVMKQPPKVANITFDVPAPQPPLKAPAKLAMGGGGGAHDIAPVTAGHLPKFSPTPIVPPMNPPKIQPKLAVDPAINVQTNVHMMNNNMPNIGVPNAPNVGVASLGNGSGGGLGSGNGNGLGPGTGGNTGGGAYQIGGDVSAPQLIYQVDPEFSEEARKAKFQGEVLVSLVVDATGRPTQVKVVRPVGMGLDEKAMEAVRQYKFRPARKGGQPVPVLLNVAVNFQIF
jgi:periplasmic protein TonB